MKTYRFHPKLNKKRVAAYDGHLIYSVDPFAVRNIARPDEEFSNFATADEFPDLIPRGEIWLSDRSVAKEGLFFVADALTRIKEQERGTPEDKAYEAGLEMERRLREHVTGLVFRDGKPHKHVPDEVYVGQYITLPDPEETIEVWRVDGNVVRSLYKTDYTEGGHGYVYPWIPKHQIWVEQDVHLRELPFIVCHEYIEVRLMRDEKIDYDTAHAICSKVEFLVRKGKGLKPIVVPGRRRFTKADLPRLTRDKAFAYVRKTYVDK